MSIVRHIDFTLEESVSKKRVEKLNWYKALWNYMMLMELKILLLRKCLCTLWLILYIMFEMFYFLLNSL